MAECIRAPLGQPVIAAASRRCLNKKHSTSSNITARAVVGVPAQKKFFTPHKTQNKEEEFFFFLAVIYPVNPQTTNTSIDRQTRSPGDRRHEERGRRKEQRGPGTRREESDTLSGLSMVGDSSSRRAWRNQR